MKTKGIVRMTINRKALLATTAAAAASLFVGFGSARAAENGPIKIGVISEAQSVVGESIINATKMAAEDVNAHGGVLGRKLEIVSYDDHSKAPDAVRAFQRAVNQDKVSAVVGSFISEIVLALEPWAARLHTVYITPGASSTKIPLQVHENYKRYKYVFAGSLNSVFVAKAICDFDKAVLVKKFHMKTAWIMSEDAAWTTPLDNEYLKCLPEAGLKVVGHTRFNPDTSDFTPIFNKIEAAHPDLISTGFSHVGVQPTVQWFKQQVPIAMGGQSSQATTSSFWKDTNGAAVGVITGAAATPSVALTPKTIPFGEAYVKKYGASPSYASYSAYDDVHIIANAINRAGTTNSDKVVEEIEKADYTGTIGVEQFYGKTSIYAHDVKYGPNLVPDIMIQWQNGKQVVVWPEDKAQGKVKFPSFVKLPSAG